MTPHIGIAGVSVEGALLCFRTICVEGEQYLGQYDHPEVSMHMHSLGQYMACIYRDDWSAVAKLMLSSARKLAQAGATLLICPDNTVHQAFAEVEAESIPAAFARAALNMSGRRLRNARTSTASSSTSSSTPFSRRTPSRVFSASSSG